MVDILLLLVGFVALIVGADKLVDGASSLAKTLGVPTIVIGLTIVAFGTSAPELVVNVTGAINQKTDLVIGNIIGSNIFNALFILGISAIIYPLTVKRNTTWLEVPLNILASVFVIFASFDIYFNGASANVFTRSEGLISLLFFAIFLVYNAQLSISGDSSDEQADEILGMPVWKAILFVVLGFAGLVVGGKFIVESATNVAKLLGMSDRVIALTVVSVGTSLPELATSVVAARKKNVDIAIGNVIGSNIFNIFFILGTSTVVFPVNVPDASFIDLYVNLAVSILLFALIFIGKKGTIGKGEGALLVSCYFVYLGYLLFGSN